MQEKTLEQLRAELLKAYNEHQKIQKFATTSKESLASSFISLNLNIKHCDDEFLKIALKDFFQDEKRKDLFERFKQIDGFDLIRKALQNGWGIVADEHHEIIRELTKYFGFFEKLQSFVDLPLYKQISKQISEAKQSESETVDLKEDVADFFGDSSEQRKNLEEFERRNTKLEQEVKQLESRMDRRDAQSQENIAEFERRAQLQDQQIRNFEENERVKNRSERSLKAISNRKLVVLYKTAQGLLGELNSKLKDLTDDKKKEYVEKIKSFEEKIKDSDKLNSNNLQSICKRLDQLILEIDEAQKLKPSNQDVPAQKGAQSSSLNQQTESSLGSESSSVPEIQINLAKITTLAELRDLYEISEDARSITFSSKLKPNESISIENTDKLFEKLKNRLVEGGYAVSAYTDAKGTKHLIDRVVKSRQAKKDSEKSPESVIIDKNNENATKGNNSVRPDQTEEKMKTAAQIFQEAKRSSRVDGTSHAMQNGVYNTAFKLDGTQIHAAALLRISQLLKIPLNEAAQNYYITDVSIPRDAVVDDKAFEASYGEQLRQSKDSALAGKPAFITFSDGHHAVLVSLVRDAKEPEKIKVVYANSMPMSEYGRSNENTRTGYHFLLKVITHLKVSEEDSLDVSIDQQYDDCCGLSVAENIASIAKHCNENGATDAASIMPKLTSFTSRDRKKNFYQYGGKVLFEALDNPSIDFNAPFVPVQPKTAPQRPASAPANQQPTPPANADSTRANSAETPRARNANSQPQNQKTGKKVDKKADEDKKDKNKEVKPENHDKEKDTVSWTTLFWTTGIFLAIGAFAPPLAAAAAAAVIINVIAAVAKAAEIIIDAVKGLIEAITSFITGILGAVKALFELFGKGIDYVVTKVSGKERVIKEEMVELDEEHKRAAPNPRGPEPQTSRNADEFTPNSTPRNRGEDVPQSSNRGVPTVQELTIAGASPIPDAERTRGPIIEDLPSTSSTGGPKAHTPRMPAGGGEPSTEPAPASTPAPTPTSAAAKVIKARSNSDPILPARPK